MHPDTPGHREDIVRDATRGLELDASEELALSWLAFQPWHHVKTIANLMERLRDIDAPEPPDDAEPAPRVIATEASGFTSGNSGPGF